jgi:hypothetical protein
MNARSVVRELVQSVFEADVRELVVAHDPYEDVAARHGYEKNPKSNIGGWTKYDHKQSGSHVHVSAYGNWEHQHPTLGPQSGSGLKSLDKYLRKVHK